MSYSLHGKRKNTYSNKLPPLFPKTHPQKYSKVNKDDNNQIFFKDENNTLTETWPTDNKMDMIVEVPSGSYIKYERDDLGNIRCDRILHTAMAYPGNYGYIPFTLSGDGDPTDIILLTDYALQAGIYIKIRVVGVLLTEDEKDRDEKILAVPCIKVDPQYESINDIDDIPKVIMSKVRHFFEHYKDNEPDKWVRVMGFKDKKFALKLIKKHHYDYDVKYRTSALPTARVDEE